MSVLSEHHKVLDEEGRGKCSVPMWCNGLPADFCDGEAFGEQEKGQLRYGEWRMGRWYPAYCSGLACFMHGGPESRVFRDGEQFCAVYPGFINLHESKAGFGSTLEEARSALKGDA